MNINLFTQVKLHLKVQVFKTSEVLKKPNKPTQNSTISNFNGDENWLSVCCCSSTLNKAAEQNFIFKTHLE